MSEDDLFCLFDEAFGSDNDVHRKVKFINCILQLHQGMQETVVSRTRIYVPKRIRERWCSYPCGNNVEFLIGKALSQTNVGEEKFKKCWKTVQPTIPEEELFRLFKKGFNSRNNLHGKVDFINDILRRYKGMTEPVCDCVACLSFVSMCCVGLLLYQCSISCVLIALTDWTMTDTAYPTGFVCLIRLRSTPLARYLGVLEPFVTSHA